MVMQRLAFMAGIVHREGAGVGAAHEVRPMSTTARAARARPPSGTPPNPFATHVAAAMLTAEPAAAFAERVLQDLDRGAPFYWHAQPGPRAWIAGRHRAIGQGLMPFNDFGAPQ